METLTPALVRKTDEGFVVLIGAAALKVLQKDQPTLCQQLESCLEGEALFKVPDPFDVYDTLPF